MLTPHEHGQVRGRGFHAGGQSAGTPTRAFVAPHEPRLRVPWAVGDDLADHSEYAVWLGEKLTLDLSVLGRGDGGT